MLSDRQTGRYKYRQIDRKKDIDRPARCGETDI